MDALKSEIQTFYKYKDLVIQLVSRDLKLKYRRSFLGYVWSVLNPLLIMIVMTIVFSTMFDKHIENFPVYLLTGRTLFEFMTTSTNAAMRSIIANASLIKKTYVPKYIFTFAKVTSCLVDFVLSLGALLIVMIATRAKFTPYFFLFPLVVIQIYIFCMGLGLFLAQANVFFRDMQYIYKAITTAWMYLSAIFYPLASLPLQLQNFIKTFNQLYYYIQQFRDFIYEGHMTEPRVFIMGWIIAFVMLGIGAWTFKRSQDRFILYI